MSTKIVGLFVENYIGKSIFGHNCNFKYKDEPMIRYHFMLLKFNKDGKEIRRILSLERCEGECSSGWCCACWINPTIKIIDKFPTFNYIPINDIEINFNYRKTEEIQFDDEHETEFLDNHSNIVFSYTITGNDRYYPHGSMTVNIDLFKKVARSPEINEYPVWIVCGKSGLGKTSLFTAIGKLNHKQFHVLETDSFDSINDFPKMITENIIVVGHRHEFSLNDIKAHLPENSKIIFVNFKEYK